MRVEPYIADASAAAANKATLGGLSAIAYGFITSTEGALFLGAIATVIGIVWGCVAGVQRWCEHRLRMKLLKIQIKRAEAGEPITVGAEDRG